MKVKHLVLSFFVFGIASLAALAQPAPEAAVDNFVKAEMERKKIPGVSVAVIKDGKPAVVKGYGLANIEHNVPVKPETIFQSGSVGKQFTAFAVMLLVEEGKIRLDEPIGKYLGDVPETWAKITVRHLLTHTGGMTDYPRDFDFRKDYTEDDLLKTIKETPLAFAPGEKWQYSNFGFVTLGIVIRKVSGKFYGDFLAERVFKPLGMTTARVISERDIVPNRSAGYVLRNGEVKNQEWVSPTLNTTADGALYLSILDMIRWEEALAGRKLLSKDAYEKMWTPVKLNGGSEQRYGFGWALRTVNGFKVIEHGGAWQGFKSFIARYPDRGLTVIALANSENANPARLGNGIAEAVDPAVKPKPMVDPEPERTAGFRKVIEDILAGKPDEKRFSPRLYRAISDPNDRLIAYLKTIGPILKFELLERTDIGEAVLYKYAVEFESMNVIVEIGEDKKGIIGYLELQPE
ncbi:MAG TPA: serine hydrolase domain-containing protein [Pyrinomonadaceae bacterium]|nr:serine hydrolase domain-containing protein [Pyrinomonadaceae bacterium]